MLCPLVDKIRLLLGRVHESTGRLDSALSHYNTALVLYREHAPGSDVVASTLTSMGRVFCALGRGADSEAALLEARRLSRRLQTRCAGPGCERRVREDGAPLHVCVKCRRTFYCGKGCQTADWKAEHKPECKSLIAEAAVAARKATIG